MKIIENSNQFRAAKYFQAKIQFKFKVIKINKSMILTKIHSIKQI